MNYADSLACHRCFKDKSLIEYIREEGKRGWCDWCGGRNVYVVPLYKLGDLFRDAVSIYKQNDDGLDSISFLFQEDWEVFSDKLEQDPDVIQGLTVAILTAGLGDKNYHTDYPDYDGYFRREESKLVEYWHEKAEAYFERGTDSKSPAEFARSTGDIYADFPDQLEFAFEELSKRYEPGKVFYRARIHRDRFRKQRFELDELGAPQPDEAVSGRANRKGEPVLYMASDDKTALSEVRAWKGSAVAIATVRIKERISVVSLLKHEFPESPFSNEVLSWEIQLAEFFYRLAYELSMPVGPHESDQMYFSTQYLCNWIRKSGYHGIEYPSATGGGHNIVLFNPNTSEITESRYVRITNKQPSYENLDDRDEIYEEGPFDCLFSDNSGY